MKLVPQLFSCYAEGKCRDNIKNDFLSGITVGIVALPLAIAFAIASGVSPEQGIYTAIIAGFIISFFGGSTVQIGGPTGAFIVVVFSIVQRFGYEGLAVATIMAGFILIAMGVFKLGAAIKFIPYPMTVGFTAGIAMIIAITQVNSLIGVQLDEKGDGFIETVSLIVQHLPEFDSATLMIGLVSIGIILVWPRITTKIPGSIVAIVVGTLAVSIFNLPVATIGSTFGPVSLKLATPDVSLVDMSLVVKLIPEALTIAILAAIESLLSAVVADGMTGQRHRSNMELVAQGIANIFSPLFGGIPATGAIARTATNIKNGAKTPISGIVHSVTLLLILLIFGKLAALIPLTTLSAILLVVAYHMSEWKMFLKLFKSPLSDIFVMLITFILTVFVDLTVAIEIGVVASALLFMYRMANLTEIKCITNELNEHFEEDLDYDISYRKIPDGVEVFEIHGPFFFGAANSFKDTLTIIGGTPSVLILRMRHIMSIDATAMRALEDVYEKAGKKHIRLILSGIDSSNLKMLDKFHFTEKVGLENILPDIDSALERAEMVVSQKSV